MKYLITLAVFFIAFTVRSQTVVGTWQLTEDKTCFATQFEKTDTEKELEEGMGASRNAVAKLIKFDAKGGGEEGIFSMGKKKGSGMTSFRWKMDGQELQFLDKKSGMITQRFVVDELGASVLRIHNAMKDCEIKVFTKVK